MATKNSKKKLKITREQKRSNSLSECFDKRVIMYPDNRKWIGNFNELIY